MNPFKRDPRNNEMWIESILAGAAFCLLVVSIVFLLALIGAKS